MHQQFRKESLVVVITPPYETWSLIRETYREADYECPWIQPEDIVGGAFIIAHMSDFGVYCEFARDHPAVPLPPSCFEVHSLSS